MQCAIYLGHPYHCDTRQCIELSCTKQVRVAMGVPAGDQCGESSEGVCIAPSAGSFVVGEHPKDASAALSLYVCIVFSILNKLWQV